MGAAASRAGVPDAGHAPDKAAEAALSKSLGAQLLDDGRPCHGRWRPIAPPCADALRTMSPFLNSAREQSMEKLVWPAVGTESLEDKAKKIARS